jgi:N-methylhydantoinase B
MLFNMSPMELEEEELADPTRNVLLGGTFIPDSAGPGRFRGGAAKYMDNYWIAPASHFTTYYHFKRAPSFGVYGGQGGLGGAGWVWDGGDNPVDPRIGVPRTLSDPVYRDSRPLVGLIDPDSHELSPSGHYYAAEANLSTSAGSIVRLVSTGAGGWGDPLERDVDLVLRDVRDEYVSIEGAARDYGVVISGDPVNDPEGLVLDLEATNRLRSSRKAA